MSEVDPAAHGSHDRLIRSLAADLTPVKRLRPPEQRALAWLAMVGALAVVLAVFSNLSAVEQRLMAVPDMALAAAGSMLTAILAAFAAFALGMPDRRSAWALLPLPGLVLWIGASGLGCLRAWVVPGTHPTSLAEAQDCLVFIIGLSIPLSAVLIVMLRRACPLRPGLTGAVGGLAVAATAATLLNFFHPYDAAATDLAVHAVAVLMVVALNEALAGRLIAGQHMSRRSGPGSPIKDMRR
jgi:hypothetical protein